MWWRKTRHSSRLFWWLDYRTGRWWLLLAVAGLLFACGGTAEVATLQPAATLVAATLVPMETARPTETAIPPTETARPTETVVPPTETARPTETVVPPTETARPTETTIPPTETAKPIKTAIPPTETAITRLQVVATEVPQVPAGVTVIAPGVWKCPESLAGAVYFGSSKSDKFHRLLCSQGKQIKAGNRICFVSREAARAFGYVACKACGP